MSTTAEALEKLADRIARLEKAARQPERVSWRPREVAMKTGLAYDAVLDLIHSGDLGAVKCGRGYIVPDAELRALLARGTRND